MPARVVVVGLGPAGPDLVTQGTRDAIAAIAVRYLRTTRHPAASVLEGSPSFDHVYEDELRGDGYRDRRKDGTQKHSHLVLPLCDLRPYSPSRQAGQHAPS